MLHRLRLPIALLLSGLVLSPVIASAHGGVAHGNHDAQHGGFVTMYKDLHFEVVALPTGGMQVWFTDALRKELPAAVVSELALEVERVGGKLESVRMSISGAGDCWEGRSAPVTDGKAIIRLAFVAKGEPVQANIAAASLPRASAPAARKPAASAPATRPAAAQRPVNAGDHVH